MGGIRRTIYLPSEEVWEGLRLKAAGVGMSVSQYLIGEYGIDDRLGRIEVKVDLLLSNGIVPPMVAKRHVSPEEQPVVIPAEKLVTKKVEVVDEDAWRSRIMPIPKKV